MDCHHFYIYSYYDFSIKSAGATRMIYYAKALANDGHKVYLVSCCSNQLTDADFDEIAPNIFVLARKQITKNPFKTFSFLRKLHRFSRSKKGSRSYIYYPTPLVALEVLSLFYLKGLKRELVFSELNEVPKHTSAFQAPMSLSKPGYCIKKIIFKTVFTLMEPMLYFYDGLICISTAMEDYGHRYNKNTLRIPILTDPDFTPEKSQKIYQVSGDFNIGFSGSIHPTKEDLENFLAIIAELNAAEHKVTFNLCGFIANSYKEQFEEALELRNDLKYYGMLDQKELSTFLSQQDVLVIPRGYNLQNKYGFSTKLSDYLNHKKIILITDISDNKLYIKDGYNGFVVPPDNPRLMKEKIIYIIENFKALEETIIPRAFETSRKDFYFLNYRDALQNFLKVSR